jgi:hypothetical protein
VLEQALETEGEKKATQYDIMVTHVDDEWQLVWR